MDLILRNANVVNQSDILDIGIKDGKIAALQKNLANANEIIDLQGRLVIPPFCETHIHLDKSCILSRCKSEKGTLEEAIAQVALQKKSFTEDDVYERACKTLEKAISHGTMHMRTHVEVDPTIGLRGLEGVFSAIDKYKWALNAEVCVFPQEGLTNNPGTEDLMIESMKRGAKVVGGAPYTDSDSHAQIDRIFKIAKDFDADIDMHLDFGNNADHLDIHYVCDKAKEFNYGGRVTVGHATKLTYLDADALMQVTKRLSDSGVAVTVLPSTDLYLMGRDKATHHTRGVVRAHEMLEHGVNCSLSTNNVLNPFTPFGDCSLIRVANLYANITHVGALNFADCLEMVTNRSAKLMRIANYGISIGNSADLVVLDCTSSSQAVSELAIPLYGFKNGRRSFTRNAVEVHHPHH
jgi:cytosine/creatinine deaminase